MTRLPLFTVLLPTYNRPEVLTFAIQSVLDQTVPDFELLVIGDGCTDNTADVVKAFGDPRIRWFDLPKAPYFGYANRNVILQEARGEYTAFMAHDDLWLPDHLELLEPFFRDNAIEIAYSRPLWVSPEGHISPLSFNLHDPEVLEDFLYRRHNSLPAACFVYRSHCLERYGAWDETLTAAADWDLWARIIEGGGRNNFAYLPTPTSLHFLATWRTEANAGPGDLLTWRYRTENSLPGAAFSVPVADFPTEQAAFASRLQSEPVSFSRDIRIGCQRVLDRIAMTNDREAASLLQQLRVQEEEVRRCNSRLGVFEYAAMAPDVSVIFGPGFYPDEEGERWMWREAQMFLLVNSGAARVRLTLRCDRAPHYDQFPLIVDVMVNGSSAESLIFKSSRKKHKVDVILDRYVNKVDFMNSAVFVPEKCGINNDSRELSLLLTGLSVKAGRRAGVKGVYAAASLAPGASGRPH